MDGQYTEAHNQERILAVFFFIFLCQRCEQCSVLKYQYLIVFNVIILIFLFLNFIQWRGVYYNNITKIESPITGNQSL